jgi:hypothetical protein
LLKPLYILRVISIFDIGKKRKKVFQKLKSGNVAVQVHASQISSPPLACSLLLAAGCALSLLHLSGSLDLALQPSLDCADSSTR